MLDVDDDLEDNVRKVQRHLEANVADDGALGRGVDVHPQDSGCGALEHVGAVLKSEDANNLAVEVVFGSACGRARDHSVHVRGCQAEIYHVVETTHGLVGNENVAVAPLDGIRHHNLVVADANHLGDTERRGRGGAEFQRLSDVRGRYWCLARRHARQLLELSGMAN